MSIHHCHRCGHWVDESETDPDGEVCCTCAAKCKECGVDIDPDDKHRDCWECRQIARVDAMRDQMKDERLAKERT